MNIGMLNDRVLLKLDDKVKKIGSFFIPDTGQDAPQTAVVIAVHPGRRTIDGEVFEPIVSVGDRVLFGKYSGSEIELDGESYLCIREDDLLAVIAEETEDELSAPSPDLSESHA